MGDLIKEVFKWANTTTKKIAIFAFALISLAIINNYFGLSYYYNLNQKVDVLIKLELLQSKSTDSSIVNFAINQKNHIEHSSTYFDAVSSFFINRHTIKANAITANGTNSITNAPIKSSINLLWVIMSVFMGYLIAIFALLACVFIKMPKSKKIKFLLVIAIPSAGISTIQIIWFKSLSHLISDYLSFLLNMIVNNAALWLYYGVWPVNKIMEDLTETINNRDAPKKTL